MIKLFTHTDLDGVGCAILAYLSFGTDNVDVEYCNYDDIDKKIRTFGESEEYKTCEKIYITDISVSEELAKDLDVACAKGKIQLLDHHATALNLNKYNWCKVKVENLDGIKTSGTELFYNWLVNEEHFNYYDDNVLYRFVKLVRDYDTWRWASFGDNGIICKQVNDLLYLYGRDKFINWCISEIHDCVFPRLYTSDELVLEVKQKEIDNYVEKKDKQLIISELCGRKCGFVFAEQYVSELGNRLCEMHPEIDFVAMIDMNGTVSYRSVKDNIDLGKDIAKVFSGGGHPKAAGSRISNEIKMNVINNIFEY